MGAALLSAAALVSAVVSAAELSAAAPFSALPPSAASSLPEAMPSWMPSSKGVASALGASPGNTFREGRISAIMFWNSTDAKVLCA